MIALSRFRLDRELARWRAEGHRPILWWRDDDARGMSPALDRLLASAGGLPLSLAVIPDGVSATLAKRLLRSTGVTIAQHGIDHINLRQPDTGPAADYTQATAPGPLARGILSGCYALEAAGLEPVFYTPPWNRIEPVLLDALVLAGYSALSGWNEEGPFSPSLRRLDTHIDLLRWRGRPRFRGAARIYDDLRTQLAARRRAEDFSQPIGLLTHHLDHDEESWNFLDDLLAALRPEVDFATFDELVPDEVPQSRARITATAAPRPVPIASIKWDPVVRSPRAEAD
jgi:hypothetical protein